MEITHGYKSYRSDRRSSLTIGNFDGYHLGHQRILDALVDASRTSGTRSVLMSFLPHPLQLLMPEKAPRAITPLEEKIRLLGASRLEVLAILDFDRALSQMTGEAFVREIIVGVFRAQQVFVGSDFAFGHRRTGSVALLRKLSLELDFQVRICPQVVVRGSRVSSTRIRELIHAGRISSANRLLGRYFTLTGTVVPGRGLGRESLFPTLNLRPGARTEPPTRGVRHPDYFRPTDPSLGDQRRLASHGRWKRSHGGNPSHRHPIGKSPGAPQPRLSSPLERRRKVRVAAAVESTNCPRLSTRPPLLSSLQPVGPTGGAGRLIAGLEVKPKRLWNFRPGSGMGMRVHPEALKGSQAPERQPGIFQPRRCWGFPGAMHPAGICSTAPEREE